MIGSIKRVLKRILGGVIGTPKVFVNVTTTAESDRLADQVVLITGGGSGIGKAVATFVVKQGGKAIVVGRRQEKLEEVSTALGIENCRYIVKDVTEIANGSEFFKEAESIFGKPINGFVCNAGVYIAKKLLDFNEEDYNNTFDLNLKQPMFLMREYLKYCAENKVQGNIVVTTSNRGLMPDYGPYGLSKIALNSYIEGLAREYTGSGIRINGVAPGMTASEINNIDINGDLYTGSAKGKRVLLPDEIAEVVTFLLSNNSRCITGAIIPCDEGDRLR